MNRKDRKASLPAARPNRHGGNIRMAAIRHFARQVAERFRPDKIVLFGSYAWGAPHAESDVDILVVMPAQNQHDQAVRIRCGVQASFAMDLLVRTPANLQWRLAEGDSFHTEIMTKGKVLYEKSDARVGPQGRGRLSEAERGTSLIISPSLIVASRNQ